MANTPPTINDGLEQGPIDYENLLNILELHLKGELADKPFLIKNGIKIVL